MRQCAQVVAHLLGAHVRRQRRDARLRRSADFGPDPSRSCVRRRDSLTAGAPGPEGSIQKIFWSELNQRFQQVAQEVLGPYAQLEKGCDLAFDDGQWAYSYLRARGNTIEAGTSEIQRNIIGHFVLGLPRSY